MSLRRASAPKRPALAPLLHIHAVSSSCEPRRKERIQIQLRKPQQASSEPESFQEMHSSRWSSRFLPQMAHVLVEDGFCLHERPAKAVFGQPFREAPQGAHSLDDGASRLGRKGIGY